MGNIKALIFDLDGTLLDSLEDLADSVNLILSNYSMPTHSLSEYPFFVGNGIEILVKLAAPKNTPDIVLKNLIENIKDDYAKRWTRKTKPYPGIRHMLDKLRQLRIPAAILSNKQQEFTELMVSHFFPANSFFAVKGSRLGQNAKPNPTEALSIAHIKNLSPDQIMLIGDSGVDMDTALAAGMLSVGVLWGFRPESELMAHGAKAILNKPDDIFLLL